MSKEVHEPVTVELSPEQAERLQNGDRLLVGGRDTEHNAVKVDIQLSTRN